MPLVTSSTVLSARTAWEYYKENTTFTDATQVGAFSFGLPDNADCNHVFAKTYTLTAAATQTVDLYASFETLAAETVRAHSAYGYYLEITGDGGALKIEPGTSNPLDWPFTGASETYTPSTLGAGEVFVDGSPATISSTARNWKLTNTGASTLTVRLCVLVGADIYHVYALNFSRYRNSFYLGAI